MVACILIPRFALRVADSRGDEPAALAPPPGERAVGEASRVAEAQGVHAGMRLGEALARCPSLRLVPADPARVAELWESVLRRLEGIGAAVESERPGEAFFEADGLRGIHGGEMAGVLQAAREAVRLPARAAVAPGRFASFAAAGRGSRLPRSVSGSGGEAIVPDRALRAFLTPLPISTLSARLGASERAEGDLVAALKRLGVSTLGALAALSADQVADRFGPLGLRARRLACGEDTPLRPREAPEELAAEIELPEGTAGNQLDRALELLVDRLLSIPRRKERTVLAVRLSARLCGGGSWSVEQGLGRPTTSAPTISSLLAPRLEGLPGPTEQLALRALALGPPAADQLELSAADPVESWRAGSAADMDPQRERTATAEIASRRGKLAVAVREVRAASGAEALLKAVDIEPGSRVPERRFLLAPSPYQGG